MHNIDPSDVARVDSSDSKTLEKMQASAVNLARKNSVLVTEQNVHIDI